MPSTASRIAVLGSAHLDLLSQVKAHHNTLDRPGDLFISYGGTGFNLAVNLAAFGHPVTFGSVLSDSAISRTIVHALQRAGVQVRIDFRNGLPEAGFSAHIYGGEMISAVASTPVERVDLTIEHLRSIILECDALVLECNLSAATLVAAVRIANELGKSVWLAGVSEAKALKALSIIQVGGQLTALFLNRRELAYLLFSNLDTLGSAPGLARAISAYVVESRSQDGVAIWKPDGRQPIEERPASAAGAAEQQHWLGAGDHLMAMTIHRHLALGEAVPLAACTGTHLVTANHPRRHCNLADANPLEERLRHLTDTALRDPLTGLLNRRGLDDFLQQLEPSTPIALLMIDIDHFKRVNDNFGHDVGDVVLSGVGQILRDMTRGTDTAVRWGGEEMIVLLCHTPIETASEVGERIRKAIEAKGFPCGTVTCSIGIAGGNLADLEHLREQADHALYEGKRSGRNRVITAPFSSSMERCA